jgi:glycosyltransferase involved in cell wall biosynthesis
MKNILFVLYHDFTSNSAIHVHNFANYLVSQGFDCTVAVPNNKVSVSVLGSHAYNVMNFNEIDNVNRFFQNQQQPDVIHAWTPREVVRFFCEKLLSRYPSKLIVHLEDNEEFLLEKFTQRSLKEFLTDTHHDFPKHLSHPLKYRKFLQKSDGVTVIIDSLTEFFPSHIPHLVLWPGVNTEVFYPRERDSKLALKLGIPLNSTVICYAGNVHPANAQEVRSLYLAIALLNREGYPTTLVRTGRDMCDFLGPDDTWGRKYAVELGYLKEHSQLPEILALADVLVQPGKADAFNNYRFPSKLPEFLAMGKPVVLPDTNIGRHLKSMENAIVLPKVDALSILETVKLLRGNPALCDRLGQGALDFVRVYLDWAKNGQTLAKFYESIVRDSMCLN